MRHVQDMPASIVQAIAKIQRAVQSVKRDGRNAHGGYDYASTDAVYAALSAKMGEAGLTILTLEHDPEIKTVDGPKGPQRWCRFKFQFVLASQEGVTWTDAACARTLYMQVLGPQTHMAAQSYAEKTFLRSLFKLPTGDLDLDQLPTDDEKPTKRKSSSQAKKDGLWESFQSELEHIETFDQVLELEMRYKDSFQKLNSNWRGQFYDALEVKRAEVQKGFI